MARAQVTFTVDIPPVERRHDFTDNKGGQYFSAFIGDEYGWPTEIPAYAQVDYLDDED